MTLQSSKSCADAGTASASCLATIGLSSDERRSFSATPMAAFGQARMAVRMGWRRAGSCAQGSLVQQAAFATAWTMHSLVARGMLGGLVATSR